MKLILVLIALVALTGWSYPSHMYRWAGVVEVSYIEGRHLELARRCPDSWVLQATNSHLEAKLESAIGHHATVWGTRFTGVNIYGKEMIVVEGVWLRGEPKPHELRSAPSYPCR